jgi:deoxyadenosine/deoxycytidine kinase
LFIFTSDTSDISDISVIINISDYNMKFVSVEGNIASGKSTFIGMLRDKIESMTSNRVISVLEPIDKWVDENGDSLLSQFYQDKKRWAGAFQQCILAIQSRMLKDVVAYQTSSKDIAIVERMCSGDEGLFYTMLVDGGEISGMDKTALDMISTELYKPEVDMIIHLRVDADTCLQRQKKRSRCEETGLECEYLAKCSEHLDRLYGKGFSQVIDPSCWCIVVEWPDLNDGTRCDEIISRVALYVLGRLKWKMQQDNYSIVRHAYLL